MHKKGDICDNCGAKMVEYRFAFNEGLAAVLAKLYRLSEAVHLGDLELTNSQYGNAPKLCYWGVASRLDENRKGGMWHITDYGRRFIRGLTTIPSYVVTYRNKVQRFEGDEVHFHDVLPGYDYRGDYKEQVKAQLQPAEDKNLQFDLF